MALSVVQTSTPASGGSGADANSSFGSLPSVGNVVLVVARKNQSTQALTVSDNQGNSYQKVYEQSYTQFSTTVWKTIVQTSSGTFTVTAHDTNLGNNYCEALEVSGFPATGAALDVSNTATGTGTSASPGSITTTVADEIVVFMEDWQQGSRNASTPTGYTSFGLSGTAANKSFYKIRTTTGSENPASTWTGSQAWDAHIVAFKAAPISGTIAATTPHPNVAAFSATQKQTGTIAATTPSPNVAAFNATQAQQATIAAVTPSPNVADFEVALVQGITATTPSPNVAAFQATQSQQAAIAATTPSPLLGAFQVTQSQQAAIAATAPSPLVADFELTSVLLFTSTIAAVTPSPLVASFVGDVPLLNQIPRPRPGTAELVPVLEPLRATALVTELRSGQALISPAEAPATATIGPTIPSGKATATPDMPPGRVTLIG